jgi:hypothetical protein
LAALGHATNSINLWLDHRTAHLFIDDAEMARLVVATVEYGRVRNGKISLVVPFGFIDVEGKWSAAMNRAYADGGRDAVVRASAEFARDEIRTGFPDDANVVVFSLS